MHTCRGHIGHCSGHVVQGERAAPPSACMLVGPELYTDYKTVWLVATLELHLEHLVFKIQVFKPFK